MDGCREIEEESKYEMLFKNEILLRPHVEFDYMFPCVTASQAELMAARKRPLRTQSEAEDIPSKDSFIGLQELENLLRERVEHADELEEELQEARRCLQTRFEGIEK